MLCWIRKRFKLPVLDCLGGLVIPRGAPYKQDPQHLIVLRIFAFLAYVLLTFALSSLL
jgi:hypothetical protein